ncbi:SH3 domain-containing protein [Nitrosospira sp. Nsp2]|uniref:SH3 domain-containing protein n=1 Tax=Nitrosospira sp. Nsp2 TaxID=136548 RepID=UPI000D2F7F6C|nr:SH3 domain-containing protein [Nitrosospira sp. Nsp2]PTR13486.1 SH3 domain-containing protein [Nitrosospira sp. Nsp2]
MGFWNQRKVAIAKLRHIGEGIFLLLLGLNIAGCGIPIKSSIPEPEPETVAAVPEARAKVQCEIELEKLEAEKDAQQQEIERLQKVLTEKDAQIRSQQARQQDQAKTLQETSSLAAQAQVKLRRLATRPAAASAIAEVEMMMGNLKSSPMAGSEEILQTQAQRLLNAATTSYAEENYASAMDHAAQAREYIDMVTNNRTRKTSDQLTVSLQVPIPLRTTSNSNLRQKPGLSAPLVTTLKRDALMIAEAYRGDWLYVMTADGRAGWVLNTLVEAQVGKP